MMDHVAFFLSRLLISVLLVLPRYSTASVDSSTACGKGSTIESSVSTTSEAVQLSRDLLLCPGGNFSVTWKGNITISETLGIVDGTSLRIRGSDVIPTIFGAGEIQIFEVTGTGSVLNLENIALYGGQAERGGAVAAHHAQITLVDCVVHDNKATMEGGKDTHCLYCTRAV